MSPEEAGWLRERIMTSVPQAYLADLVRHGPGPRQPRTRPGRTRAIRFASPKPTRTSSRTPGSSRLATFGASLLYNLLVAEGYKAAGYTRVDEPVDHRPVANSRPGRSRSLPANRTLAPWDRRAMWERTYLRSPSTSLVTRLFVEKWISAIARGEADRAADNASCANWFARVSSRPRAADRG